MTTFERLANFGLALQQRQRWVLFALLGVLHLTLLAGTQTLIGMMCWLIDVGLFILWQPFLKAEKRLDAGGMLVVITLIGAGIWLFGDWLLILWVTILASLLGSRVMMIPHRPTRICYLLAFTYLLITLLVWLAPRVVPSAAMIGPSLDKVLSIGLPVLLVAMMLMPRAQDTPILHRGLIDFFYGLFIFLLIAVLLLGSLAFMLLHQALYIEALFKTVVSMALILLLVAWAWNPRQGFSGLGVFFSRYLLSIALPFETWSQRLMETAELESDPERFMDIVFESLLEIPWVAGGNWSSAHTSQSGTRPFGGESRFQQDYALQPIKLTLFTHNPLSPSLIWHFHLLAQLANEYYLAKVRSRELAQMSYLRAVHETGARLTHDIKNLLQSLNNLCFVAQNADEKAMQRFDAVLRRQLPQITQRLQQTLEKLQAPTTTAAERPSPRDERAPTPWWTALKQRHALNHLTFEPVALDKGSRIPIALYESVAENLIQNALNKRQQEESLAIRLCLSSDASILRVSDTGSAIPDEIAKQLFRAPVPSEHGLGIGLFNAAKQAQHYDYCLRLANNEEGNVCFELARNQGQE